jgi:hypothetical protein
MRAGFPNPAEEPAKKGLLSARGRIKSPQMNGLTRDYPGIFHGTNSTATLD